MSHHRIRSRKGRSPLRAARLASRRNAEVKTATVHSTPARKDWDLLSWFNKPAKPRPPKENSHHGKLVLASARSLSHSTSSEEDSDVRVSSDSEETGSAESTSHESTSIRVSSTSSSHSGSTGRAKRWVPARANPRDSKSSSEKVDTTSSEAPRKLIKKNRQGEMVRSAAQKGVDTLSAASDKAKKAVEKAQTKLTPEELEEKKRIREEDKDQTRKIQKVIGACIGTTEKGKRAIRAKAVVPFLERVKKDAPLLEDTRALKIMHGELRTRVEQVQLRDYAKGLLDCRKELTETIKALQFIPQIDWLPTDDLKKNFKAFGAGQTPTKWLDGLIALRVQLDKCEAYRERGLPTSLLQEKFEELREYTNTSQALLDAYSTADLLAARSYVLAWEMVESKVSRTIFPSYVGKEKALPQRESDSSFEE